ncbi:hypothetical protein SAMN04488034_101857 [Salinimicrobium catena]|uniref:DUF4293 family protein n=2 Tax=Salinimicrobium catena TaxID=390640 RepID=A0A1H5JU28_9FLAO|nr:hypothetical protein SAMN04488140_101843 [Salinimicrobium catena]SEE56006.1 hypothetical protein SAMN04488034_101857 [Salinimicrobium catena]
MNDQRLAIILLAVVGIATTFMPWVKIPVIGYEMGTQYGGWITLGLFLVIFILGFIGDRGNVLSGMRLYGIIFLSLVAAVMGIWNIVDLDGLVVTVEYGLYLMTLTAVVIPLVAFIVGKGKTAGVSKRSDDYSYDAEVEKQGSPD